MKRPREDDDYDGFCQGLEAKRRRNGELDQSLTPRHRIKRPKINPNYETMKFHYGASLISYTVLHPQDELYKSIRKLITYRPIVIDSIIQVTNPILETAYSMKMCEKKFEYGEVREELLFHGTKHKNVHSICTYNFDWRLYGRNRGHKFGKGVNFSPFAKYAKNFCDPSYHKVMIIAKVLITKICQGQEDMSLPPAGYDTTQKDEKASVIVKYEDNEFLPAYILHFHLLERHREKRYNENYNNRYYIDQQYNHQRYNSRYIYDVRCGRYRDDYFYSDRFDGGNVRYF